MSKLIANLALYLFVFSISYTASANAAPSVFTKSSFEEIKRQNLGKKWLMILWSIDCPPCFKELAIIQKLQEETPNIAVVIVNVDDNNETARERQEVINSYKLSTLSNYYFADGLGDQSRYLIDKSWYGELPRSYFIAENGDFHGKSGLVKEGIIKKWLVLEEK